MPIKYLSFHPKCERWKLQSRLTGVFFSKWTFLALFRLISNRCCTDLSFNIERLIAPSDNDLFKKCKTLFTACHRYFPF